MQCVVYERGDLTTWSDSPDDRGTVALVSLSPIVSPKLLMSSQAVFQYRAVFHALDTFRSVRLPPSCASTPSIACLPFVASSSCRNHLVALFMSVTRCHHTADDSLTGDALQLVSLRRVRCQQGVDTASIDHCTAQEVMVTLCVNLLSVEPSALRITSLVIGLPLYDMYVI